MARLILLAAGLGRRMEGATGNVPKPMVPLPSGLPLLIETLGNALTSGRVEHATVVTGHLADSVESEITRALPDGFVDAVFNPFYAAAGPLGSVWAVRSLLLGEDVLLGNGDTLYTSPVFDSLAEQPDGLTLAYSRRAVSADDVKVLLGPDETIDRVGKDINAAAAHGASAGLLSIRGRTARGAFVRCLDDVMRNGRGSAPGAIWHNLVNELAVCGPGVHVVQVGAEEWHEVDTPSDLALLGKTGGATG